jgi:hypothetical protein
LEGGVDSIVAILKAPSVKSIQNCILNRLILAIKFATIQPLRHKGNKKNALQEKCKTIKLVYWCKISVLVKD